MTYTFDCERNAAFARCPPNWKVGQFRLRSFFPYKNSSDLRYIQKHYDHQGHHHEQELPLSQQSFVCELITPNTPTRFYIDVDWREPRDTYVIHTYNRIIHALENVEQIRDHDMYVLDNSRYTWNKTRGNHFKMSLQHYHSVDNF